MATGDVGRRIGDGIYISIEYFYWQQLTIRCRFRSRSYDQSTHMNKIYKFSVVSVDCKMTIEHFNIPQNGFCVHNERLDQMVVAMRALNIYANVKQFQLCGHKFGPCDGGGIFKVRTHSIHSIHCTRRVCVGGWRNVFRMNSLHLNWIILNGEQWRLCLVLVHISLRQSSAIWLSIAPNCWFSWAETRSHKMDRAK